MQRGDQSPRDATVVPQAQGRQPECEEQQEPLPSPLLPAPPPQRRHHWWREASRDDGDRDSDDDDDGDAVARGPDEDPFESLLLLEEQCVAAPACRRLCACPPGTC